MKLGLFALPAAFLLAFTALMVGCGDGNDRAATVPDQPVATSTLETSGEPDESAVGESDSATISEERLSKALLTINDMPTGWTTTPPEAEDDDADFCGVDFESTAIVDIEVGFQQSQTGPFIGHSLQLFPAGEGKRSFEAGVERASSCTEFTVTNEDGTVNTWRIWPLSFPEVGDDTLAFRVRAEVAFFGSATVDIIASRRGDVISVFALTVIGFGSPEPALTERLVRLADDRLREVR